MEKLIDKLRRWQLELRRLINDGGLKPKDWEELLDLRKKE